MPNKVGGIGCGGGVNVSNAKLVATKSRPVATSNFIVCPFDFVLAVVRSLEDLPACGKFELLEKSALNKRFNLLETTVIS